MQNIHSSSLSNSITPTPIIIFDFDSTLIGDESLVTMLKKYTSPEAFQIIENITNQGINHEITMVESYKRRLQAGKPTKYICQQYIDSFNNPTPGMKELLIFLKEEKNALIYCVSQGIQHVVSDICNKCFSYNGKPLIKEIYAIPVDWENDIMSLSSVGEEMLQRGKTWSVKQISQSISQFISQNSQETQNTLHGNIFIVGDGVSDMEAEADVHIAYVEWRDSEQTRKLSDYVAKNTDELKQLFNQLIQKIET